MKQVLIRNGRVVVEEMTPPALGRGAVLVRPTCSLISTGTELAAVAASAVAGGPARWRRRAANSVSSVSSSDEGRHELLSYFLAHVRGERREPIPRAEIFRTSRLVRALDRQARGGIPRRRRRGA
jgi:hypothetical protein